MSGLPRWKENRIRHEIYLGHLKHTNTSPSGAGFNGANRQGWNGTSVLFLEETPGMGFGKTELLAWPRQSFCLTTCASQVDRRI